MVPEKLVGDELGRQEAAKVAAATRIARRKSLVFTWSHPSNRAAGIQSARKNRARCGARLKSKPTRLLEVQRGAGLGGHPLFVIFRGFHHQPAARHLGMAAAAQLRAEDLE